MDPAQLSRGLHLHRHHRAAPFRCLCVLGARQDLSNRLRQPDNAGVFNADQILCGCGEDEPDVETRVLGGRVDESPVATDNEGGVREGGWRVRGGRVGRWDGGQGARVDVLWVARGGQFLFQFMTSKVDRIVELYLVIGQVN